MQAFHGVALQRQTVLVTGSNLHLQEQHKYQSPSSLYASLGDDDSAAVPGKSSTNRAGADVTDKSKATFDIASDYSETGIAQDSSPSPGFKVDSFSM